MYDSSMVTTDRLVTKDCSLDPTRPALLLIDVQPKRTKVRVNCPHWLLALISSVFKERPGTHHYCRCWCRVSEGLFRTDCSAGKSPAAVGGPLGSRSDGMVTVAVARVTVNALPGCGRCRGTAQQLRPGACSIVPGLPSHAADSCPLRDAESAQLTDTGVTGPRCRPT